MYNKRQKKETGECRIAFPDLFYGIFRCGTGPLSLANYSAAGASAAGAASAGASAFLARLRRVLFLASFF